MVAHGFVGSRRFGEPENVGVGSSVALRQALVFSFKNILAVSSFEPPYSEVAASHSLEMRDERVVYNRAANGTDDRNSLRRRFFCDYKSEA